MAKTNNVKIKITAKNTTKAAFRSVTSGLKGVASAAFSMKTAIGLAAGAAGLGYMVKRSMNLTDELTKSSRAIGVSVEALQRLRHAANLGGMESKALDKAVQKLAINIAEVATGTGEAKDAFEKYGITATNADGSLRSVGSVMDQVAGVMQGMTNQTERASLAYDLFGARGAKMVNVLKDGKAGLHAAMLEADQLGLVMSEKTVAGVEAANDAITRLTSYISGVFNRVVAEMAPYIKAVTDNIRSWITLKIDENGGVVGVAKNVAESLETVYTSALSAAQAVGGAIKAFNNWRTSLQQNELQSAVDDVEDLNASLNDLYTQQQGIHARMLRTGILGQITKVPLINELGKVGDEISATMDKLAAAESLVARLQAKMESSESTALTDAITNAQEAAVKPLDNAAWNESLQALNKESIRLVSIERLKAQYSIFQTQLSLYEADVKADNDAWEAKLRSAYMAYGKLRAYGERQNALEVAAEKQAWDAKLAIAYQNYGKYRVLGEKHAIDTRSAFEKAADGIENAYKSMQSSVENTLTDLLVSGGNWKDAMMNIADMVYREFVRVQIAAPLAEAGNTFLKDFFQHLFKEPPKGGAGRALGGPVLNDRSYIVGENGPEVFTPGQNGHISPNTSTPVNITYNIKSWDSRDTMTAIQSSAPQIVGIVQQAFNKRGISALGA